MFCASAADGKLVYEQDLEPAADRIYASPLVADGKVFYLSRTGAAYVIEAGRSYKLLSRNSIPSDTSIFNASPVPLAEEGRLLLRSNRALYCIGTRH